MFSLSQWWKHITWQKWPQDWRSFCTACKPWSFQLTCTTGIQYCSGRRCIRQFPPTHCTEHTLAKFPVPLNKASCQHRAPSHQQPGGWCHIIGEACQPLVLKVIGKVNPSSSIRSSSMDSLSITWYNAFQDNSWTLVRLSITCKKNLSALQHSQ